VPKVNPHCRIGKVMLKGGAQLSVFRSKRERATAAVIDHYCIHAKGLADAYADDMAGFLVMAWDWKGAWIARVHSEPECELSARYLPTFLPEIVRTQIAESDVRDLIKRMF
jgi:hypothetical protein